MIGNDAPLFGRLVTAMVTPFDDDLKLDIKSVDRLVEHLIATGSDTILVAGTTGESPTLEDEEKKQLLERVIKRADGRAKVMMGSGTNSTASSKRLSVLADALGAQGVLLVVPYYNKPSQEGMLRHFEEVSKAVHIPVMIYNIPGRTSSNLSVESMVALASRVSNVHALKDSTGNVEQATEVAIQARQDLRIYSGDDNLTLPFLSVGACGVVSVASHLVGLEIKSMMESYFAGEPNKASSLNGKYHALFKGLFVAPNPTCIKYALSRLNLCKENLRLPLVPLDAQNKKEVQKLLAELSIKAQLSTV